MGRAAPGGARGRILSRPEHTPVEILRVLVSAGVRFIIIGGVSAQLRGSSLVTSDLDVCYARDSDNLGRLASALRALGARLRGPNVPDDLPFVADERALALGDTFTLQTDLGALDIVATPSGTMGFPDLEGGATVFQVEDGLKVRVCSLDDLIRMKRAARRAKDLVQLEELSALRERIEAMRMTGGDPQQGEARG